MSKLSMFAVTLALALPFATSACGGCPWTTLSALSITPATPCLDIHLANASGTPPSTGCVDPVIYGHNSCADSLVVPAKYNLTDQSQTFLPGDDILIQIPLETSTQNHGDDFSIPTTLGADTVTIGFHASGGIDH